ncbi:MAG: selenocysteine-specific translation elongation factor [Chloroflexi bacterium]|nr:selenocysteine-specific translation elongation factor [Chloroflexota bacterium]
MTQGGGARGSGSAGPSEPHKSGATSREARPKAEPTAIEQAVRVIGTAGHVDHGKSTLIKTLTGIDPDRLREEQERGMTIDLGFAHLRLPRGTEVGIVDVPGHHDLVRNMLAGVGSIDAVILVVAADEGVMPQTREHLAILALLGIERGVIALTKRDLVDADWVALVTEDVRAAVRGTPLAQAEVVPVSSSARTGLDELLGAIERVLGEAPVRRDLGRPRLPIDRAFTMAGFGTVVTGTLIDGGFAVGEEVEIVPGGRRARIRGLQTHRRAIAAASPGRRVAMNLTGVDKADLERGMTVVRPGTVAPLSVVGLRLVVLPSAGGAVEHDEALKVHIGTAEVMARVSVLEGDAIAPGEERWAQLRLAQPVVAVPGDRLVVRRPSPPETLGGGVVADVSGERFKRRAEALDTLVRRAAPTPAARLLAVLDVPRTPEEAATRAGLEPTERDAAAAELVAAGVAIELGDALLSREAYETLATRVERTLAMGHRRSPLRAGVPRDEVRGALGLTAKRAAAMLAHLVTDGRVAERGTAYALPGHRPTLSAEQEAAWRRAREALARDPLQPPSVNSLDTEHGVDRELRAALAERGDVVRVVDAAFLPEAVRGFGDAVIGELATAGRITVSRARDLTGSSRKHVLPLLQFLDDHGVTRRIGDDRVLVHPPDVSRSRLAQATSKEKG